MAQLQILLDQRRQEVISRACGFNLHARDDRFKKHLFKTFFPIQNVAWIKRHLTQRFDELWQHLPRQIAYVLHVFDHETVHFEEVPQEDVQAEFEVERVVAQQAGSLLLVLPSSGAVFESQGAEHRLRDPKKSFSIVNQVRA